MPSTAVCVFSPSTEGENTFPANSERTPPIVELREHFASLCRANNVTPRFTRTRAGSCFIRDTRELELRPIKTEVTYIAALRHLGWWVGPRRSETRHYHAAGAWCWATVNGHPLVTASELFAQQLQKSVTGWVKHATWRGHRFDDADPLMEMVLYGPLERERLTATGRVRPTGVARDV